MQRNICCQQLECLYHVTPSDVKPGGFGELFAGQAGVARCVGHLSVRAVCAYEPYPHALDDMAITCKPDAYIRDFDLLLPDVVVDLLPQIYCREITSVHLGPPCVSLSKLYQNLGPGRRSHKTWYGILRNAKEVMRNKTIGVCMLVLRAIWETGATATLEHPLSSGTWRLQCIH